MAHLLCQIANITVHYLKSPTRNQEEPFYLYNLYNVCIGYIDWIHCIDWIPRIYPGKSSSPAVSHVIQDWLLSTISIVILKL